MEMVRLMPISYHSHLEGSLGVPGQALLKIWAKVLARWAWAGIPGSFG
jgi:hypothetical protein